MAYTRPNVHWKVEQFLWSKLLAKIWNGISVLCILSNITFLLNSHVCWNYSIEQNNSNEQKQLLVRCQMRSIKGTLCVAWPEVGGVAVNLLKSLLKNALPNLDISIHVKPEDKDLWSSQNRDHHFDSDMYTWTTRLWELCFFFLLTCHGFYIDHFVY